MTLDDHQSGDITQKRARAVKTAIVLGVVAVTIFAIFVGSAVIGR